MNKLPVFRVAGRAIGFTLWNSFTIFRLGWLPITALFAAQIGLSAYIMQLDGETPPDVPNPLLVNMIIDKLAIFNIAFAILEALAIAAVAVSIHRVILFGDRKPGQYFNFGFGKTEFLYIVMGFLTALLMFAVLAVFFSAFAFIASGGDPIGVFKKFVDNPEAAAQIVGTVLLGSGISIFLGLYFVTWIFLIYLSIRLAVWPPAVVATNRISPSEPWQLTRGNVWRFIGAFILTFGWIYLPLTAGAYWYYKNQMPRPDVPAITAPSATESIDATGGTSSGTPAPAPSVAPPAPARKAEPMPEAPSPSAAAGPIAAPQAPVPPPTDPDAKDVEVTVELPDATVGAVAGSAALIMWVIFVFIYVFFTALVVALMSFSYKALKGYEAHEPIPEE